MNFTSRTVLAGAKFVVLSGGLSYLCIYQGVKEKVLHNSLETI
jgi:hypothetical protein